MVFGKSYIGYLRRVKKLVYLEYKVLVLVLYLEFLLGSKGKI